MVQEIEMTKEEQMIMYMKCSKRELCEMLIEANKHLKNLPIHVVVGRSEQLCECNYGGLRGEPQCEVCLKNMEECEF